MILAQEHRLEPGFTSISITVNIDNHRYKCRHRYIHLNSIDLVRAVGHISEQLTILAQEHRLKPGFTFISMMVNIDDYRYKCRHRNIHLNSIDLVRAFGQISEQLTILVQEHRLEPGFTSISITVNIDNHRYKCRHRNITLCPANND